MADMDEVATLLHIHEKTLGHGDVFKNIRDAAWARLKQIDEDHGVAMKTPVELDDNPEGNEPAEEGEEANG